MNAMAYHSLGWGGKNETGFGHVADGLGGSVFENGRGMASNSLLFASCLLAAANPVRSLD